MIPPFVVTTTQVVLDLFHKAHLQLNTFRLQVKVLAEVFFLVVVLILLAVQTWKSDGGQLEEEVPKGAPVGLVTGVQVAIQVKLDQLDEDGKWLVFIIKLTLSS